MEDELEEVKCDIRKAKTDLERAQERGNEALELEIRRNLTSLLKEKERLTTGRERIAPNVAVPAPPVPAPALVSSAPRYLRRTYILFNLTRPCSMLAHGVREFLVGHFCGRPIGGQVYRVKNEIFGQCIILRISGDESSLRDAEEDVLNLVDESGQPYWSYELENEIGIPRLTTHSFSIAQSLRGGIRGENSDPKYDNKSESRSRSHSSKPSTQSGL